MSAVIKKTHPSPREVDELAVRWLELKESERKLRDERWALEEQLAIRIGAMSEGERTVAGQEYTFQLQFRIRRVLDERKWDQIRDRIPVDLRPVRMKPQLDTRQFFDLLRREPGVGEMVERAVDLRPSKVSVRVSRQRRQGGR